MQRRPKRRHGEDTRITPTCTYCQRSFRRIEHLTRHVRIHTKERPFKCQCGAAFARRDLLVRHGRAMNHEENSGLQLGNDTGLLSNAAQSSSILSLGQDRGPRSHEVQPDILSIQPQQPSSLQPCPPLPYQQMDLSPEFLQNVDFSTPEQFREFGHFLDGLGGISAGWSSYFADREPAPQVYSQQASDTWAASQDTPDALDRDSPEARPVNDERPGTPVGSWLPAGPRQAKIVEDAQGHVEGSAAPPTDRISVEHHAHLTSALESFRSVIDPDFQLPSQHALGRYVASGFEIFIRNLPFIHHTWRVVETSMELLLAMSTVGAHYTFEQRASRILYRATKAILIARLLRERSKFASETIDLLWSHKHAPGHAATPDVIFETDTIGMDWTPWEPDDTVPTLLFLSSYTSWQREPYFVEESIRLQRLLAHIIRDLGLEEEVEPDASASTARRVNGGAWRDWIRKESSRRAKLSAFAFMNASTHAYNVYPVLRSSEVFLRLPCTTKEWNALTLPRWQAARKEVSKEQLYLHDALQLLLTQGSEALVLDPWPTPLGNYVLLHALVQRIFLVRDLLVPTAEQTALPKEETERMERALQSWALGFKVAPESSTDDNQDHGPIPFTCSATLALAYIRLNQNYGPHRQLQSRDPAKIAHALSQCPPITRNSTIIMAVLHATHATSIPVRLGLERVARNHQFFWTIRHSLSGFECAVILSQWLANLACTVDSTPLSNTELHIVGWVRRIIREAYKCVDFDDDDYEFHEDTGFLSLAVLKVWACFFKRNALSVFINVLGDGLDQYRCMLRDKPCTLRTVT